MGLVLHPLDEQARKPSGPGRAVPLIRIPLNGNGPVFTWVDWAIRGTQRLIKFFSRSQNKLKGDFGQMLGALICLS